METMYLVPTRGRPENALRLAHAFTETASADARLVFLVDDDDPKLTEYHNVLTGTATDGLRFGYQVGPRLRLGGTLNLWAPRYALDYGAIGFMGDDHLPITQNWDQELAAEIMRNSGGLAYGNDLIQGANLPTAVLMDAAIVRALGYMVPPGLTHMYLDNFWRDLGQALGKLAYRADVIIQHLHPLTQQVAWDEGYIEVAQFMGPDDDIYQEFVNTGALGTAAGLVLNYYADTAGKTVIRGHIQDED